MDAVGSADELAVDPDFDGVGVTGLMKSVVGVNEGFGDPGAGRAVGAAGGAGSHDGDEGLVEGDLEAALGEGAGKAAGEVEPVEGEDGAAGRVVPGEEGPVAIGHGEYALAITGEDLGGVEAHGAADDVHWFDCMRGGGSAVIRAADVRGSNQG